MALAGAGAAQTIDPSACAAALRFAATNRGVSVLVLQDGKQVCASPEATLMERHELWSGTKSFLGLIAAAAVQDKFLALDEPVATTVPEWSSDPLRRTITIRHLLSMTSGQASQIGRPPGYADALNAAVNAPPGTRFQYGPTPSQIFGEVMRRKLLSSGRPGDVRQYLQERLLTPIGIANVTWRMGPDGAPLMPQGASLSAREWARVGEFVRVGGRLNGVPLVDPETFAQLFKGSDANPAYGLSWWLARQTPARDVVSQTSDIPRNITSLPGDLVYAAGIGDQRLYVIPSHGLTIVRQAQLDLAVITRGQSGWSDTKFLTTLISAR
ncbi:MAG: beta-lactamase family protein [Hyphomonadaceae bacterium]|nr:beta-lactamase family protein [Hyphomonadaceae bacterium]